MPLWPPVNSAVSTTTARSQRIYFAPRASVPDGSPTFSHPTCARRRRFLWSGPRAGEPTMLRATPDSPRMFESDFIDFFSRTPWTIVPILFVPGAVFAFWGSVTYTDVGVLGSLGLTFAGFVLWTLTEYWLHRLFFHWEPPGKWGERMHFLVHGVH